jgi:hypothetical protein
MDLDGDLFGHEAIGDFCVGDRTYHTALPFMQDLKERLANRVQLTSDGHRSYIVAVDETFGDDVDYAMLQKLYGADPAGERRYSPAKCIGARGRAITGQSRSRPHQHVIG